MYFIFNLYKLSTPRQLNEIIMIANEFKATVNDRHKNASCTFNISK